MPIAPFLSVAEVMDKEPGLTLVWLVATSLAVFGFAAGRYRPSALLLIAPLVAVGAAALLLELFDPHVGPALRNEASGTYLVQSLAAVTVALVSPMIGLWIRRHARLA